MTATLPLLSHRDEQAVFAWREGAPVTVAEFLADVAALAERLPTGQHVLNVCRDRYLTAVGFAAAVVSGKVSLLPSTRTPDTIEQLRRSAPDLFCLVDGPCEIDLPQVACLPRGERRKGAEFHVPEVDADRVVARVYTSGSTGVPVPHAKTWRSLVECTQAGRDRLALPAGTALLGTVPAQHMYGFESTLLIAFHGGLALSAAHPFYPGDVAAELARLPAPRLLVSTPVHLRALLASGVALPALQMVLCATAPLSTELAAEVEREFGAPLLEIYGSTETGQIATRRTARTDVFELFPGVQLTPIAPDVALASGGHLTEPTPLHDVIEPLAGEGRFRLLGRGADMVNIAGKRSSLAHLNHQLCSIPGVLDGAFHAPASDAQQASARLMAFVVAPGLTPTAVRRALRPRIDPAFMPRPLVLVDALPRNATGKLPRSALAALAQQHATMPEPQAHDA